MKGGHMENKKTFRPSRIEASRSTWKRIFEADPISMKEIQRSYQARNRQHMAEYHRATAGLKKWDRLIFKGHLEVMEIACINCSEAFLVRASKTNSYARFCPICSWLRTRTSKNRYEKLSKTNPWKRAPKLPAVPVERPCSDCGKKFSQPVKQGPRRKACDPCRRKAGL